MYNLLQHLKSVRAACQCVTQETVKLLSLDYFCFSTKFEAKINSQKQNDHKITFGAFLSLPYAEVISVRQSKLNVG